MAYEFIKVDREGPVTIITLNRPDVMNALHSPAHFELHEAFDAFAADPEQWVGIVTGAAPLDVAEAQASGADLFVTGEVKEQTQEWCRESRMNFLSIGHYASEQFGVQSLGRVITRKFGIPCEFVPVPNRA